MLRALCRPVSRDVTSQIRCFASSSRQCGRVQKTKTEKNASVLATLSKTQAQFKTYKPVSPGLRHLRRPITPHLYPGQPVRILTVAKRKTGGRNNHGHITTRHIGGGHKQRIRLVDFKRVESGKQDVIRIEYDPGRSAHIALLKHRDPNAQTPWSYILAVEGMRAGTVVESFRQGIPDGMVSGYTDPLWNGRPAPEPVETPAPSTSLDPTTSSTAPSPPVSTFPINISLSARSQYDPNSDESSDDSSQLAIGMLRALVVKPGNVLPLRIIPPGTVIHAISLDPNGKAVLVRSAGSSASVVSQDANDKDGKYTQIRLQSGEVRHVLSSCIATIGRVSNPNWKDRSLGKAGRSRRLGIRPSVRGVAMNA